MNQQVTVRKDPIGTWPAVHLSNSLIQLSVVPSIGGRVMDLCLGETNVFYQNPRHYGKKSDSNATAIDIGQWKNYGGSKVWPWPQGWSSLDEWPGPPDPVLDSGAYELQVLPGNTPSGVSLKSPHDEYSGITLEREIKISPGTSIVSLHHTMRNTSRRPVRWSIWQVSQVNAAQGLDIFVPVDDFRQTLGDEPYKRISFDASSKMFHLAYDDQVAQFAVRANQGWVAALDRARGTLLAELYPARGPAQTDSTPPGMFWVSGKGTFTIHGDCIDMSDGINGCDPHIETEIVGPLTRLEPGESSELRTSWRLAAMDADEIISVNQCGAIGRKLTLGPSGTSGSFGVFFEANLRLVAFDRASQVVGTVELGAVTPLRPVLLKEQITIPSNAVRCSLLLFDENDSRLGALDHVEIR